MRTARMLAEAQGIVAVRMMGLAGMVPMAPGEAARMVIEKQTAFTQAGLAATAAMMAGRTPTQVWGRALTPVGRTTRANAKRLTHRRT